MQQNESAIREALEFLKNNIDPQNEVQDNWNLCFTERIKYLETHHIFEYLKIFPALRTQLGSQLLLDDFNRKFPNEKNALYSKWDKLARAIALFGIKNYDLSEDQVENPIGTQNESRFLISCFIYHFFFSFDFLPVIIIIYLLL